MKVMSIIKSVWGRNGVQDPGPAYGEICTVTATEISRHTGRPGYRLAEYPVDADGLPVMYAARQFIPCSSIDETELVNQKKETV